MEKRAKRKDISLKFQDIGNFLFDGMSIAIGGYLTANKPMALIREIIKQGAKNLTIISLPAGLDLDLLIAAGCVYRIICPYVGMESLSPIAPFFRQKAQKGELEIREVDVALVILMLRAAALNLPYVPWKGVIGTSIPELNPDLKIIEDPFGNGELVAVPAFSPDLALIHATQSDVYGNIQHNGRSFSDGLMARASKKTLVQVEKIVPNEEIKANFLNTTIPSTTVHGIILAPFGAHPLSSQKYYDVDEEHIKEYIEWARKYLKGETNGSENYLQKYVYGPHLLEDYLKVIGTKRLSYIKKILD
jgi:glutaconate CoA-transferase subunit A